MKGINKWDAHGLHFNEGRSYGLKEALWWIWRVCRLSASRQLQPNNACLSTRSSAAHSCASHSHAHCGWPLVDDQTGWMNEWFSFVRFKLLHGNTTRLNGNILRASMILFWLRFREKWTVLRVRLEPRFELQCCHFLPGWMWKLTHQTRLLSWAFSSQLREPLTVLLAPWSPLTFLSCNTYPNSWHVCLSHWTVSSRVLASLCPFPVISRA